MYTAPTALISLVVLLPIIAGLAAIYYSHVNMVLGNMVQQEKERAVNIAVLIVSSEISNNNSLKNKLKNAALTDADLAYLSKIATQSLQDIVDIPYRVNIYIEIVNTSIVIGTGGYQPYMEPIASYSYQAKRTTTYWSYVTLDLGDGKYAIVGCGI